MCGIAGTVGGTLTASGQRDREAVAVMLEALRHRGPDSRGVWSDPHGGMALGTARLAIHDLTAEGSQPMLSMDGRYVLSFNGEVYNFEALRRDLEYGQTLHFRGRSDTEVLLAAIQVWGLESALLRVNGMFALAVWDRSQRTLVLARDRLGEKPLYYFTGSRHLVFASELGAIQRHPAVTRNVDRKALSLLLRYNYVPSPWSAFEHTYKLPPGCTITVNCKNGFAIGEPVRYWSLLDAAVKSAHNASWPNDARAVDTLEDLLLDAVRLRMEADVPVGAFLSGGVDSSLVVALMQRLSRNPVKTYTIASRDAAFDESAQAAKIAAYLGTSHESLEVSPSEALAVISRLPHVYSEPFADSSQIPTFLLSELARRHVTVSLSGDGGDELFGGYNRHRWVGSIWRAVHRIPLPVRRAARTVGAAIPPAVWRTAAQLLPSGRRPRNLDLKAQKVVRMLDASTPWSMYQRLLSPWEHPDELVIGARQPTGTAVDSPPPDVMDLTTAMMAMDAVTYLPDDVLVKLDRATMAVGLEGRVPLLDHRVVDFAFSLPPSMRTSRGQGKWILREVLSRYVPRELTDRPKTGFDVPIADWLRGPLKAWASDLLDPATLRRQGYLRPEPIAAVWRAHLARAHDHSQALWGVLMFQQWLLQYDVASEERPRESA